MRRTATIAFVLLLVLCSLVAVIGGLAYFFFYVPAVEARPVVLIGSPTQGAEVRVGDAVLVQASARDQTGVARVELWVDGQLVEAQRSPLPGGSSNFPLVTRWEPTSPGNHTLAVRAFNGEDARSFVSLSVNAVEVPDRDGDSVPDEGDSCPDEAGSGTAAGCPDADGDGVADAEDACPSEVGTVEGGGCALAAEGDRDGDGLLDESDACPDEPGLQGANGCPDADGDGVADADDACPSEAGVQEQDGCPAASDLDGDGVDDEDDDCPGQAGLPELGGCPDADGDGVRDPDDLRPDEPGDPENHGAPDTGAPDSDGDGLADDVDRCDEEAGPVENEGCPPPGAGADLNGDGRPDDTEAWGGAIPLWPFPEGGMPWDPVTTTVALDVEALGFQTFGTYDEIYCYIGLAGEPEERYGPFEPEGQWDWDIAALLGGENSKTVLLPTGEDLEVRLECSAYQISREVTQPEEGFGEVAEEDVYFDLGSFTAIHPEEDWDGQPITKEFFGAVEGRSFRATYRICRDSCEETAMPVPHAFAVHAFGGQRYLGWTWDGDPESIDGFHVHYDCYDKSSGHWWVGADVGGPDTPPWGRSIEDFEPECRQTCNWYVQAYNDAEDTVSPRSNIAVVDVGPCPRGRSVVADFKWIRVPEDLDGRGPIYGEFWANDEVLSFDGADPDLCGLGEAFAIGLYLGGEVPPGGEGIPMDVAEMFHIIEYWRDRCPEAESYEAPRTTAVTVNVPEGEALEMGMNISEYNRDGDDTWVCNQRCQIEYDDLESVGPVTGYFPCGVSAPWESILYVELDVYDWEGGG